MNTEKTIREKFYVVINFAPNFNNNSADLIEKWAGEEGIAGKWAGGK